MPAFVDLAPGVVLQVYPETGPLDEAYQAVVRSVSDAGVHLSVPRRGPETLPLAPGHRVRAFAAINGQIFRFDCTVKMTEQSPQQAVVLAPPEEASNAERREFFRLITRVTPRYAARVDHDLVELQPISATILDISGGGLQVQTREWVPTGSLIRLIFVLDDDPLELDVQAVALSVLRPERQQHYRVHLRFVDVSRADVERVVRHVFRQQVAMRRKGAL